MENNNNRFKGLDNKEIVLVYYRMKNVLEKLNQEFIDKKKVKIVEQPMIGKVAILETIPDKHIEKMKSTLYYQLLNEVVDKLKPTVELIEDCDESVKQILNELR